MPEFEIIKTLVQTGASGMLILVGWGLLQYLKEERKDRKDERDCWFDKFDLVTQKLERLATEITTALGEMRSSQGARCPLTGADRAVVEEFERRIRERKQQ